MADMLRTYRTARIRRTCDSWYCEQVIEPGERYLRVAYPPGNKMGYEGWWTLIVCRGCMTPREGVESDG